jgi:hypothetical protein
MHAISSRKHDASVTVMIGFSILVANEYSKPPDQQFGGRAR